MSTPLSATPNALSPPIGFIGDMPITPVDALSGSADTPPPATGSIGQAKPRTLPPLSNRAADLGTLASIKVNLTGGVFFTDAGAGIVTSGRVTFPLNRSTNAYLAPSAVLRLPNQGNESLRLRLEGGVDFSLVNNPQTKVRAGPFGALTQALNFGGADSTEVRLGIAFGTSQRLGQGSPFEFYADGKAFLATSWVQGAASTKRLTFEGEGGLRYTDPTSRTSVSFSAWGGYNAVFGGADSAGLALGPSAKIPIKGGPTIILRAGYTAVGSGSGTPDAGLVGQRPNTFGAWGGLSWDF
jgi:hypothetical protein